MSLRMTRSEYRNWAEQQPRGRFELVHGRVVPMTKECAGHARLKMQIWKVLDDAVRRSGVAGIALGDGVIVEVGEDTDYEPDALVNGGDRIDPDAFAAPHPVIAVEVLSPLPLSTDCGGKLADYFRVPSIEHYLIVCWHRKEIVHHRRAGDRIETPIVTSGPIALDPPGIAITVEDVYRD